MSALGQKRTFGYLGSMSALPPKADIGTQPRDVRFVPKVDILFRSVLSTFIVWALSVVAAVSQPA